MMYKINLQIFYLLSSFILIYSYESEYEIIGNQRAYDLNSLTGKSFINLRNSHLFSESSYPNLLKFSGIDDNFVFQPSNALLQQNSSKCFGDLLYTIKNLKSLWALKLIDSFGKPESGILQGNFKWIGEYNECIGIQVSNPNSSTVGHFRGKYCSLTWSHNITNFSIPLTISSGVCVPDSCKAEELQDDVVQLLQIAGTIPVSNGSKNNVSSYSFTCKPTERHLNTPAKAVIAVISVFCALTLLGSLVTAVKYFKKIIEDSRTPPMFVSIYENNFTINDDYNISRNIVPDGASLVHNEESDRYPNACLLALDRVLNCFCVFTNGAKILNTGKSEGELLCIHGIRFLSMTWIILGHTYLFGLTQMKNILEMPDLVKNFAFQAVLQGFYAVDSFFVLSGFLVTYLSMKEFSKTKGGISWPYFYIHRYIRLTPMYMILLGFSATVYLYLGSGPYWTDGDIDPICRDNWWRNLIYINNFDNQTQMCMAWSWYLANDMQFYIISPIFLITLWRWPVIGYTLLAAVLFVSWSLNFYLTYHYDLITGLSSIVNNMTASSSDILVKVLDFFDKLYTKPYTRIGPYLIGMLTGYILFKNQAVNKPKHSLIFLSIGWIIASAITLTCVYGLYQSNPSVLANSFYNALNRTGFALGLCWVIYVCLIGQGGFVNQILSFKMFIPLSRLTYAAYLIHPMILSGYFLSLKASLYLTHTTVVVLFLSFVVVTYGLSLPVALILESPIVSFEKLLRRNFTRKPKTDN